MTKLTRYSSGVVNQKHKGKISTTSTGNNSFDRYTVNISNITPTKEGIIPAGYEHRPDLIANLFYNNSTEWWRIMLLNNVPDPFEGFNVNDRILLPK